MSTGGQGNSGGGNQSQAPSSGGPPDQKPAKQEPRIQLPPFEVEFGDSRNRGTFTIDVLRMRVRGSWIKSRFNTERGARALGDQMNQMPDIPGIRMQVDPARCAMRLYDPLTTPENVRLKEQIENVHKEILPIKTHAKLRFMEPIEYDELTVDQMKTLLIEVAQKLRGNKGVSEEQFTLTLVRGQAPLTVKELESYPGRKLYDPWSNSVNKPKYEDQAADFFDAWRNLETLQAALAMAPGSAG